MKTITKIKESALITAIYVNDVLICKALKLSKNHGFDRNDKYYISSYTDNLLKIVFPFESAKSIKEVVNYLSK